MRDDVERALAPLIGLRLWGAGRAADLLWLQFGARQSLASADGSEHEVGQFTLHIACPWRVIDEERILVGSGDLLTPVDPDEDPETFDWEQPGASWLDVRLSELLPPDTAEPWVVESVAGDGLGGFRLGLGTGAVLEVFTNATPTGHVTTEFWRLLRPGTGEPQFVVGTFGTDREHEA